MGEEPGGGSLALNITAAVVSFAAAALIFSLGWKISDAYVWRFSSFAEVNKADWSARLVEGVWSTQGGPDVLLAVSCVLNHTLVSAHSFSFRRSSVCCVGDLTSALDFCAMCFQHVFVRGQRFSAHAECDATRGGRCGRVAIPS